MIIDFIKLWIYYPKMKKRYWEQMEIDFPYSRIQYAVKLCKMTNELRKTRKKSEFDDWKCLYQQEPIEKGKC